MKYLLIFLMMLHMSMYVAAAPVVATNTTVSEQNFSQTDIAKIFTRKKSHWGDGHKITVFVKDMNSIEHKMFIIDILKITPYKYKSIIDSVIYSGENTPVIETTSDSEMLQKLSTTPYSVGYINYTVMYNDSIQLIQISYD